MKLRLIALAALVGLLSTFVVAARTAAAASPRSGSLTQTLTNVPITNSTTGQSGLLNGTIQVTKFAHNSGQLLANGTINGTVTYADGSTQSVSQAFSAPVASASGSCTILDLTLGPIDLNLLGLVIQTNTIHLTITAQQGPGNLLGNLLCAIANLLNGGPLGSLSGLLNEILARL